MLIPAPVASLHIKRVIIDNTSVCNYNYLCLNNPTNKRDFDVVTAMALPVNQFREIDTMEVN